MQLTLSDVIDPRDPDEDEDEDDAGWGRWYSEEVLAPARAYRDRMDARRP